MKHKIPKNINMLQKNNEVSTEMIIFLAIIFLFYKQFFSNLIHKMFVIPLIILAFLIILFFIFPSSKNKGMNGYQQVFLVISFSFNKLCKKAGKVGKKRC